MKKTKAQLEKENAKLSKQLEFYKKACVHQPATAPKIGETPLNQRQITDNCPPFAELSKVPTKPVFQDVIEAMDYELTEQAGNIHHIMSKIVDIDGGLHFVANNEDKIYDNGVCGTLKKYLDMAKDNRIKLETIRERLKQLVG